ncbi:MaoC dehydratase-like protein [Myceligenerans xiligouense]|uniref:MaoC dehydratase-like protein n=1 Tax=Myceligenerans xiligouense TaxID=253184 RepID=A0A3N4ZTX5_9MICO|nr:MaoC dehydratase-like protein [Myceligenerans xiligouense]
MTARAGAPSSFTVTEFAEVPSLGGLYAKGAAGSVAKRPRAGVLLPQVAYRVPGVDTSGSAARLAEYQEVVGEPASGVLSAGFLHVLAFPLATAVMVRQDFPLGLLGMVHLRQAARVLRPVRIGDRPEILAWAENARAHRRGVQVDLVAEVLVDGVLAYRGVSTYLAKGFSVSGDAGGVPGREGAGQEAPDPDTGAAGQSAPDAGRAPWSPPLPTARWRLGKGIGPEYGAVSGDRNPIHMSALGAKAFGFPRAIAHGMYTAARALAEVGPARRGDAYEWTTEFFKPVLLPGSVDLAIRYAADSGADVAAGPAGGFVYDGWRTGRTTRHFTGTVTPL